MSEGLSRQAFFNILKRHFFSVGPLKKHSIFEEKRAAGRRKSLSKRKNLLSCVIFLLTGAGHFTKQVFARWAIVQLAGRRILVPLIVVQVHVAQPTRTRPHRLAGPGQRPFTPSTAVQIRLGTPNLSTIKNAKMHNILAFFIFSFQYGFPKSNFVRLHPNILWVYP